MLFIGALTAEQEPAKHIHMRFLPIVFRKQQTTDKGTTSTMSGIARLVMVTSAVIALVQLVSSCDKSFAQNAEIR
jgi:hypothetical protein